MKAIVFGVGNYYREQKEKLDSFDDIEIVAFADNNSLLWDKKIDGITVISPNKIQILEYDKVIIMSIYVCVIYEQLLSMGIVDERIIIWKRFFAELVQKERKIVYGKLKGNCLNSRILIISADLDYNGGTLAAMYAALSLKRKGISVVLAAPKGNRNLIEEIAGDSVPIVEWISLPYIFQADTEWIEQFETVIINTFQMMECAYEISKLRPTIWWIHEPLNMYKPAMMRYLSCRSKEQWTRLSSYAVSIVAQGNFNGSFDRNRCEKILPVGIPDMAFSANHEKGKDRKMVFAIIGTIHHLKAQDIFVRAASETDEEKAEFWIIGRPLDKEYYQKIQKLAVGENTVKFLGELSREELDRAFGSIDVVVCASHEETLSMTVIEGMMYGKVCITTEHTGIVEYIENGINGFVIPPGDVDALAKKMSWLVENRDKMERLKKAARNTYEKYFTLDILGENLKQALNETTAEWRRTNQET